MNYYKANTHEILPKSRNRTLPITSDNHDSVTTHLESDILEGEVKWGLGSITIKLGEVMEFQLSYFKS